MTITARLRQIAERLDANETERMVILAEIRELSAELGFDSPAPSLTPVEPPGAGAAPRVTVGPLPATEQANGHASETFLCPRCDRPFGSRHAVDVHVGRKHPDKPAPLPSDGEHQPARPKPNSGTGKLPGLIPGLGQ